MSSAEVLQTAIQAARAGRKEEARGLLFQIVEDDPRNETAWIWLSWLVVSLEDRMIACENVLTINPGNEKVRAYLAELHRQKETSSTRKNVAEAASLLNSGKHRAEKNDIDAALYFARQALDKNNVSEEAWLLVGRYSPDIEQRIAALSKAYQLNQSNTEAAAALKRPRHVASDPINAAAQLEQLGKYDEALSFYQELAAKAGNSQEFDHIYKQILRIEGLQGENIRYVAPASSIIRLTFSWPLLYISLALMQMGLNPLAHPAFYLWLGLPFVFLGTFLLSLAEVRSRHIVWQTLFDEHGDGSTFARLVATAAGWFLIIIPHILLVLDSLERLRSLTIPPIPS